MRVCSIAGYIADDAQLAGIAVKTVGRNEGRDRVREVDAVDEYLDMVGQPSTPPSNGKDPILTSLSKISG